MKKNPGNPLLPSRAVVLHKIRETENTFSLKLSLLDTRPRTFQPGQFNMLGIPGIGEAALSFSSLPIGKRGFVHTIRIAGNVTGALSRLGKGDRVHVRGPFGNGWPVQQAKGKNVVIVAGGIGMAPLRPVVHYLLQNRKSFGTLLLLYGVRSEEDILYKDELEDWLQSGEIKVLLSMDEKPRKGLLGARQGVVTNLLDAIDVPLADSVTFTCGPEIMMRFVARQLIIKGQGGNRIFVSLERRMKCGTAHCGHCQIGAKYVCKDGPVFAYADIKRFADTLL